MSAMSKSMVNLAPRYKETSKNTIEKKAWFMDKFLCNELSGSTFARLRDQINQGQAVKTRLKLDYRGLKVGSRLSINSKVAYKFYPLECIDRILQDLRFVNVLLIIFQVDRTRSDMPCEYEILAYKLKQQSDAFRFQNIFNELSGTRYSMERTLSRTEMSIGNLTLTSAKDYPMGSLAVDRWGGHQGPRSEASFNRTQYNQRNPPSSGYQSSKYMPSSYGVVPASAVQKHLHDERSDLGSFDSSDNGTTITYREVAVTANLASGSERAAGRPMMNSETNYRNYQNVSDTWCQAGDEYVNNPWRGSEEARVVVNSQPHFNRSSIISDDSRAAVSSIDDSGFGGGPDVAIAHVNGSNGSEPLKGFDVVDGTVSVRKVFNKQSRNESRASNYQNVRGSSTSSAFIRDDPYYNQRSVYINDPNFLMAKRARSFDQLAPTRAVYKPATLPYQQMPQPIRVPSRADYFNDNASVVSQGSVYYLNPKFKKVYVAKQTRIDNRLNGHH